MTDRFDRRDGPPADSAAGERIRAALRPYQHPSLRESLGQIATSFLPFLACWWLMYLSLRVHYGLTLLLAIPAAGFLIRIFIIQHDCGHGAFFRSHRANHLVGAICGVVTLTPYANWRRQHAGHHAHWNNLDQRLSGADIYSSCLTLEEYLALDRRGRFLHRLLRQPGLALVLLPPLVFLVLYRIPFDTPKGWHRERWSVHGTNLAIAALFVGLGTLLGFRDVLLVQLPISILGAIAGVWLFSVQHRFEQARWARQGDWTFIDAALRGSSYLRLPRLLQWFTGNIGFHHVHHLNPRIPNYRLEACHRQIPALSAIPALTLGSAIRSRHLWLWDEARGRLVGFPR